MDMLQKKMYFIMKDGQALHRFKLRVRLISNHGQLFEYGFSVSDDSTIPGLKKLATAMKKDGAKAILQLTHAGRFANQAILDLGVVYGPSFMELNTPIKHQVLSMTKRK